MKIKTCMECGNVIRGRSDKKFCTDVCRNSYNNRQNSDETAIMRNVNNVLRRNRRILREFLDHTKNGKVKIPIEVLTAKGFNFYYFTHIAKIRPGVSCYFCYEYGYRKQGDAWCTVLQREYPVSG